MGTACREIRVPLDELVEVLRDLNEFAVPLDRLGSRRASGTSDEHTIGTFITDWRVAPRLSHARGVISAALDAQLSEAENPAVDDLCAQGRFFSHWRRRPLTRSPRRIRTPAGHGPTPRPVPAEAGTGRE